MDKSLNEFNTYNEQHYKIIIWGNTEYNGTSAFANTLTSAIEIKHNLAFIFDIAADDISIYYMHKQGKKNIYIDLV